MSLSEASAERAAQLPSRDEAGKLWVRKDGWYEAEDWWFSLSGLCDFYAYAIDLMGDLRGRKVLDCGCGGGHTSVMLAKHGAEVTAVDLSADVLVKARRLAEVNGVEIDFRQSSLEELDLPEESFDVIFGSLILHHVDVNKAGAHFRRILKPGGKIVFVENSARSPFLMFARNHIVGRFGVPKYGDDEEHPFRRSDIAALGASFKGVPKVHYPQLLLLRLIDIYVSHKRVAPITWLLKFADETLGRFRWMRQYGYLQIVEVSAQEPAETTEQNGTPVPA